MEEVLRGMQPLPPVVVLRAHRGRSKGGASAPRSSAQELRPLATQSLAAFSEKADTVRPVSIKGLIVVLLLASSCVRVHAHQRGTLARPDMELGSTPDMASGEDHARAYREGATGGGTGKAGGCGCN